MLDFIREVLGFSPTKAPEEEKESPVVTYVNHMLALMLKDGVHSKILYNVPAPPRLRTFDPEAEMPSTVAVANRLKVLCGMTPVTCGTPTKATGTLRVGKTTCKLACTFHDSGRECCKVVVERVGGGRP